MKIGIVTQPLIDNYGGILQNYALQQALTKLGHSPFTYDTCYRWDIIRYGMAVLNIAAHKLAGRWHDVQYPAKPYKGFMRKKSIGKFIAEHIATVAAQNGITLESGPCPDALIVGSDQVWRPLYNRDDSCSPLGNSFLDFADSHDEILKLSYAASFGVDNWEYDDRRTEYCAGLLRKFKAVSVREASGIELCRRHLSRPDAVKVPDPTLLLNSAEYRKLYSRSHLEQEPYAFISLLNSSEEIRANLRNICRSMKLRARFLFEEEMSPEKWLRTIDEAAVVITDSFHCMLFSILLHTKIIVKPSSMRGQNRFEELANSLGIAPGDIFISEYAEIPTAMTKSVNFKKTDEYIGEMRANGYSFLNNGLNNNK